MTSAVLVMGGFVVALFLKNVLEPLLTSEILGGFDDLLKRRVHRAAALLPTELAADQEDEWLMELAALGARRARALLFTRGLASAAAVIAGAKESAQPTRDRPASHGDETPDEVHEAPARGSRARDVAQTSRVPAGLALMLRTQDEVITVTNDRGEPLNIQLIDGEVYVASMSDPERWRVGSAGITVERRLRPRPAGGRR